MLHNFGIALPWHEYPQPDAARNIDEIVESNGFGLEWHYVTTEDGYINTMHRIKPRQDGMPVVMLLHGLLDSSDTWVMNGPEKSLAFFLSNEGYDVWMPNFRGTDYSENHLTLDPVFEDAYWRNCTIHEMGENDLPALINYAKQETGIQKLTILAHSQGNQAVFVNMLKDKTFIEANVNLFISVSPFWVLHNNNFFITQVFRILSWYEPLVPPFKQFR
jgi:lysosomal acid lipase/cholesteryl ester hydrolase